MKKPGIIPLPFDGLLLKALSAWNIIRTVRMLLAA